MTATEPAFLAVLARAATAAQREEIAFRDSISAEIARRERDRQFAFRRLDLARTMAGAIASAATPEDAVRAQLAALKADLGWHSETVARAKILSAWTAVAEAVWRHRPLPAAAASDGSGATAASPAGPEGPSVEDAMAAFEAWYEAEHGQPFLALMDQDIPEIPVVEF